MKTTAILLVLLLVCAAAVSAKGPRVVTYQGRLTDASGAPVPDGTYNITFSIYKTQTGTDSLWTSDAQSVTVTGGLFSYDLGSNVPLPTRVFDNNVRYLGIKVGSDAELTPRIQLLSVPYAVESLYSDSADYARYLGELDTNDVVHTAGDTMSGRLYFEGTGGDINGGIVNASTYANLFLKDDDDTKVELYGQTYGSVYLSDIDGDRTAVLDASNNNGGILRLYSNTGIERITLNGNEYGDDCVELPSAAISSDEILDEPGLARTDHLQLVVIDGVRTDVDSVTLTIPGPGYVYVNVEFGTTTYDCDWACICYFRIYRGNDAIGGISLSTDTAFSENGIHAIGYTSGISYESSAGSYTYVFGAYKAVNASCDTYVNDINITAFYFPTSYGAVESVKSNAEGFDNAESVEVTAADGNKQTAYKVDLRELELKVQKAKLEAQEAYIKQLEAERQLEDAKRGNN